jgi:2,5-diketo-D-gluconate reductase B
MQCQPISLGTYRLKDEQCVQIVKLGLELGYRQIDTAELYKNHEQVAQGISLSGLPRESIFITSKIFNHNITKLKIPETVDKIKKELGVNYIDLILLHNPVKNYELAWASLIEIQTQQDIRYIGTSNFGLEHLEIIKNLTGVSPYLNQIELSIWNQPNQKLLDYHKYNNIIIQAHSIFTNNAKSSDYELVNLASNLNSNPHKLMLKCLLNQNINVVTGTSNLTHLKDNLDWVSEPNILIDNNMIKIFDCNYRIYKKFI